MTATHNSIEVPCKSTRDSHCGSYSNRLATKQDLETVYKIRYESYRKNGSIGENSDKRFDDEYDTAPNCHSFLTCCDHQEIGSIRACIYSPHKNLPIPIFDVFDTEIEQSIGYQEGMTEINKFVVLPSFQRRGGVLARFMLYKNVVDAAIAHNSSYLIAGVREEHITYNQTLFGFSLASDLRSYPHLNFKVALMVCDDIPQVKHKIDSVVLKQS